MKTTITLLIIGLLFALPLVATAGNRGGSGRHDQYRCESSNEHYKQRNNHRYERRHKRHEQKQLRRELRKTRRQLRRLKRDQRHNRQQVFYPQPYYYPTPAVVFGLPQVIFKFKW